MEHAPGLDMAIERLIDIPRRGTVVVGTVVSGSIRVGDVVEFRGVTARCTAIERYRQLLRSAGAADRVGLLLDAPIPAA